METDIVLNEQVYQRMKGIINESSRDIGNANKWVEDCQRYIEEYRMKGVGYHDRPE